MRISPWAALGAAVLASIASVVVWEGFDRDALELAPCFSVSAGNGGTVLTASCREGLTGESSASSRDGSLTVLACSCLEE